MKSIPLSVFLLIVLLAPAAVAGEPGQAGAAAEPVRFEDHFLDKALRIDLHHAGSADFERVFVAALKAGKYFAGPRTRLADPPDLGTYRLELRDPESQRVLFRHGYSALFYEWRTIAEARAGAWRALEHTVVAPYPKQPVTLTVARRAGSGGWEEILRQDIAMEERFISADNAFPDARCMPLMVNGEPAEKVDLLILGDGYADKERDVFERQAKEAWQAVFSVEPYRRRRGDFNVWAVWTPSRESGVDEPRLRRYTANALGVTFNFFDLPRYSLTAEIHTLFDAAAHAPHDTILLLFNSERLGGGGIYNLYAASSAGGAAAKQVLIHELGHTLAGLADEYFTSDVSYIDFYPDGVEPWEPNITALLDPASIKWSALIAKGTPIPTPKLPEYRGVVGCFEGAGYRAEGLYRPCLDCVMFSLNTSDHCPVCEEAVERAIDFYLGTKP